MVSFLSPKRYIGDCLVMATRLSVSDFAAVFSALVLKEGELLYMPSWNCEPSSEEADWAIIPHEVNARMAPKSSMQVFFIVFLLIYL